MEKGKLEADVCINPFRSISYGQNFVFLHYGLGAGYEIHGYYSKWGSIDDWGTKNTYESYIGILKQWFSQDRIDLATVIGYRKVLANRGTASLIGPGILYTYRLNGSVRLAGHLQYIGDLNSDPIRGYNKGYTFELGYYQMLTSKLELAAGLFTNSTGATRPIYTFNFYF